MKKLFLLVAAGLIISSCNDHKAEEKALLNDVIKTHDQLMTDDGLIMANKTKLKAYAADITAKDSVVVYTKMLDNADDAMMNWMNKFSPDFTGKSHEQIMAYLKEQKVQILKLDSQINMAVATSNKYLLKIKAK